MAGKMKYEKVSNILSAKHLHILRPKLSVLAVQVFIDPNSRTAKNRLNKIGTINRRFLPIIFR